jgi:hypothetical protein
METIFSPETSGSLCTTRRYNREENLMTFYWWRNDLPHYLTMTNPQRCLRNRWIAINCSQWLTLIYRHANKILDTYSGLHVLNPDITNLPFYTKGIKRLQPSFLLHYRLLLSLTLSLLSLISFFSSIFLLFIFYSSFFYLSFSALPIPVPPPPPLALSASSSSPPILFLLFLLELLLLPFLSPSFLS